MVRDPLAQPQCYPSSDVAGAAITASKDFVRITAHRRRAVEILSMAMTTDFTSTFDDKNSMKLVGYDMRRAAARRAYEQQPASAPRTVGVVELHGCFYGERVRGQDDKREFEDANIRLHAWDSVAWPL